MKQDNRIKLKGPVDVDNHVISYRAQMRPQPSKRGAADGSGRGFARWPNRNLRMQVLENLKRLHLKYAL